MANPRGECKAITLRSGKVVEEGTQSKDNHEEVASKHGNEDEGEIPALPPPKPVLKPYVPKAPYPQRLRKDGKDGQFSKFLEIFKRLQINIPFAEALEQMLLYAKFLKELITKKRNWEAKESISPHGMVEDLLVKVGEFIFPTDFVMLDMEEEANMSIILERPFLATVGAIIDVQKEKLVLRLHEEKMVFNVFKAMSYPKESIGECMLIDTME
ncbi:uncharacterized protein LOC130949600 [Arachis stenosperma]|uniref:uncharacterized protein LOC130949600 n=1 Tax=Arachis stenosperma TaxID=217475 RepID=UPI0025AB8016|nr:uncharacterized protein LOC130949600 [Arachis stenosperma]